MTIQRGFRAAFFLAAAATCAALCSCDGSAGGIEGRWTTLAGNGYEFKSNGEIVADFDSGIWRGVYRFYDDRDPAVLIVDIRQGQQRRVLRYEVTHVGGTHLSLDAIKVNGRELPEAERLQTRLLLAKVDVEAERERRSARQSTASR